MKPTVQSDIYSTGVLLFFLLTGVYPVTGRDLDALRAAHARGERRSLQALRGDITSFTDSTLQPLGRLAEAEQLLRDAERIDPFATEVQFGLAQVLLQAHRPAEAIAILEPLRRVDSDLAFVDLALGRSLVLEGRLAEALPILERHRERLVDPSDSGVRPWVAWAYVELGRRAEAERLAQENDRMPFRRAIINAALGNTEGMFSGLQEMAEREPQRLVMLLRAPELAPYRQDERFTRLLGRVNLQPD